MAMPTPTRALTNDSRDCKLIKLDADSPKSPCVIMQEGYDPKDPRCSMRMFYLQHNGFWIDEIARGTLPDRDAGDVVFESVPEAMQALAKLFGKPLVRALPVTEAQTEAHLARMKSLGSPKDALRDFLARYRAARGRTN